VVLKPFQSLLIRQEFTDSEGILGMRAMMFSIVTSSTFFSVRGGIGQDESEGVAN